MRIWRNAEYLVIGFLTLERITEFGPSPPTGAVRHVGSRLGYSGYGADAFGRAARVE